MDVGKAAGRKAGTLLHNDLARIFKDFPFADMIWLESTVNVSGKPVRDGINVAMPADGRRVTLPGHSLPDFLVKSQGSKPTDPDKGHLVGDVKLSANGIWTDYFGKGAYSGKTKNNQWLAITNYARRHQNVPVTLFITWNPGSNAIQKKLAKEASSRGVAMFIVSLRPGK